MLFFPFEPKLGPCSLNQTFVSNVAWHIGLFNAELNVCILTTKHCILKTLSHIKKPLTAQLTFFV